MRTTLACVSLRNFKTVFRAHWSLLKIEEREREVQELWFVTETEPPNMCEWSPSPVMAAAFMGSKESLPSKMDKTDTTKL